MDKKYKKNATKLKILLGIVVHTCNPSTGETEAGNPEYRVSLGRVRPCFQKHKTQASKMAQQVQCFCQAYVPEFNPRTHRVEERRLLKVVLYLTSTHIPHTTFMHA